MTETVAGRIDHTVLGLKATSEAAETPVRTGRHVLIRSSVRPRQQGGFRGAEPIAAVLAGDWAAMFVDVTAVVRAVPDADVKVILETSYLNVEQSVSATIVAVAGAAFVKTSTGFSASGSRTADVALMRAAAGPSFGVKASGGSVTETLLWQCWLPAPDWELRPRWI